MTSNYRCVTKARLSIIVSCTACLSFALFWPPPHPPTFLASKCAKVHFNQIEALKFYAANHLHFVVGVLSKMVWVRHSSENHRTFICRLGNKFDPGVTTDLERLQTYFQISPFNHLCLIGDRYGSHFQVTHFVPKTCANHLVENLKEQEDEITTSRKYYRDVDSG